MLPAMAYDYASQLEIAAQTVAGASYVVALSGAGLSKESGIPTFRGGDGLWDKHGEPPMDGYQRFLEDPASWWAARLAERARGNELGRAIERLGSPVERRCGESGRIWTRELGGEQATVPRELLGDIVDWAVRTEGA